MPELIFNTNTLQGFPQENYFSENMRRGQFGISTGYKNASLADSSSLSGLGKAKTFSDCPLYNVSGTSPSYLDNAYEAVAAQDENGIMYSRRTDSLTWSVLYSPIQTFFGTGMLWDGSYLYYAGDRYLGRAQPHIEDPADTQGTLSVTNGSAAVTGSSTAFNSVTHNGKRIRIGSTFYTVSTVTDGTHLTLTAAYSSSTASGVTYKIFARFIDTFKDFGAAASADSTYYWFQPFLHEGDVLIPRREKLCRLNASDGSFNDQGNPAFNVPTSLYIRCGSSGMNGILLGVEPVKGSMSYLILWNNFSDRSIIPWIPLKSRVQAIKQFESGWIVVTEREILYTNGYSIKVLSDGIDNNFGAASFSTIPNGIEIIEDKLVIANAIGGYTRKRSGIYIYDIRRDRYEYVASLGTHTYNVTPYALFTDLGKKLNASLETTQPAKKHLTTLTEEAPSRAYVITRPLAQDSTSKYLGGVKADFAVPEGSETISGTITAKVAAIKRRLWGVQKAKIAGASTSQITVDGIALGDVQVGDEITVMEGADAGLTRHISSISGAGTATEIWTLDTALTSNIEQDAYISVTPFRKVAQKTISNATELREMYFDAMNRYKGKQWLVKFVFSDLTSQIEVLEVAVLAQVQSPRT